MAIKNVAIAGATGAIGKHITKALAESNLFKVTALARSESKPKAESGLPDSVEVRVIDYTDPSSLAEALKGQDAVVSALNHVAMSSQRALIEAAVSAGVQRFIPSEFGSDTLNPKAEVMPVFAQKKADQKVLTELAAQGKMSYTLIATGPFFEMGINYGFLGLNLQKKEVTYLDGGDSTFSTTTFANVGKAVAGVLAHPEETKNRAVYVHDSALTLRDLFRLAKKALGDEGWTEIDGGTTEAKAKASYEAVAKGQLDMGVFMGFLMSAIFREGYGGHFQHVDDELLGIKELKESEIIAIIKKIAQEQTA
ncbi:hypothetical protein MMC25_006702 [Agyrium rufum]|nr:hypothetical protein [Agyrium rufum]